ncbi:hypothetical protein T11_7069 [Trichinella zimbabwensis]|uniref:Uncharacterized protein n=1 Tax=Trichinella zimbabwensis TaxID=268475 RepID=A0A0V1GLL7_9BILA|nr:hypothetical protein T11_7069 [Trichinella zimbabwensis]
MGCRILAVFQFWCKAHLNQKISRDTGKMENCNLLQLTHKEVLYQLILILI